MPEETTEERVARRKREHEEKYPPGKKCTCCGKEGYATSYAESSPEKKRMVKDEVCFSCAFWLNRIDGDQKNATIIDGGWYSPGNGLPPQAFLGMAGRRFDIEYLADGRRITTFDLWSGGKMPDWARERAPDTAKFLNGAERAEFPTGSLYEAAWNPSNGNTECYPMPNGREVPLRLDKAKRQRLEQEGTAT